MSPSRATTGIAVTRTSPSFVRNGPKVRCDPVEHALVEPDQIHLVHRQHELPDAQQRGDRRVPARLFQHPLARVDQQHGQIGQRGAGDHVARVLLVSRRIRQDESPPRRLEITIRHIDGDALVTLGRQPIDQQRIIQAAFDRPEPARVPLQRRHEIVGNGAALEQQPADEGRFAVIDAAAGEYPQNGIGHQKYPSRFFFSMDASVS